MGIGEHHGNLVLLEWRPWRQFPTLQVSRSHGLLVRGLGPKQVERSVSPKKCQHPTGPKVKNQWIFPLEHATTHVVSSYLLFCCSNVVFERLISFRLPVLPFLRFRLTASPAHASPHRLPNASLSPASGIMSKAPPVWPP